MIASIKKLVVLLLLMLPAMLPAQETGNTETRETWLSIIRVNNRNDSALVMMAGARAIGLQKGQLVKAYSKSRKAVEGVSTAREFAEIGSGSIVFSDSLPLALIRLYKQTDTLEEGDLVMVKLEVPLLPYRGIFSDLAFSNIIFTDVSRFPHYTLPGVIKKDSRKAEDSLFNVISKGLHDTYEAVKDRTDLPEELLKKAEKGRFKGRAPLEVIRDATRKDIESFFLYVIDYPVSYMGMDYRASESFAGWLVSNSPYSAGEVRNALMPVYRNKEQMKQQVLPFRADVLSEHISSTLANKALPMAANRQYKEANELVDFSIALGEAVNDVVALPEVYLSKAQVKLEEDKYAESITWCEKTIKAAVSVKDRDKESQALIKKGFCQVKLSRLAEAEQTFKTADAKLEQYREELGEDYYLYRRKIYEYTSSARYIDGKYAEALRLLDTAIAFNNRINSYDANSLNAVYYKFIGQVYNEQNRPEDALQAFTKAANIYRGLLDAEKFGEIQNERALSYYKLGSYQESIELSNEAMSVLLAKRNYDGAGYSRSLAGNCYQALGNYDSAVVANKDAIALRKKGGNRAGEAVAWENIANVFRLSGSKKLSLQAYDTAALLYQLAGDKSGLADVYNGKGRVYLGDENYKTATEWFEKAKGISNKSTVQALYRLGLAWRTIDSAKARAYFLRARSKSMEDGNTDYQFSACRSLAGMAWELQENALGDKYYEECEAISREMKTAYAQALCYSLKGYRFEVNTELDSALHYYHLAMAITDTADRNESVNILNSVASVLISKGEFRQAEAALDKAIRLADDIADTLGLASTLQFSSFLYSRTAEFEKGLVNSNRAISILSQSGHIIRLAGAYGSRGVLFSSMGENKKSVEAYLYADSLYNEELQAEQRGNIFNNIGIVYTGQGDYATALKYLQKSLATMKKGVVNEGYLLTQGNIADCYAGLKKNKEARELLLDILPKARKMKLNRIASGMAITLGKIYLEDGKLNEAKQYYQYARDYADASGEQEKMVEALVNLGRISSRENNRPDA
ncbi:MAG: tetratricopeptide repeat protein, partial [Chitinophagaceae bacterium]|nr:tetratricopeptide repeat protein [Chitinophagaceae bacterium]